MAHKRQDTFTPTQEWAKHLRPFWKRKHTKAERKMVQKMLRKKLDQMGIF